MLNLSEYQDNTSRMADYLPWGFLVAPDVILNKDGSFQSTIRYRGPDVESQVPAELASITARINNVLKRFGSGWALFLEAKRQPAPDYPTSDWPSKVAWLIDEERRARFADDNTYFESRYFLTLCWQPPADRTSRMEGWLVDRADPKQHASWRDHLEQFQTRITQTADLLASTMPEADVLEDEALLTYLHGTVSTAQHKVSVPPVAAYLDHILCDDGLTCGLEPKLGKDHLRVLTIKGLPPASEPGLLDEVNRLGFSYRWMTRFLCLDTQDAQKLLEKNRRHWFAKRKSVLSLVKETLFNEASQLIDTDAENKAIETDQALQDLGSDAVAFGYATTTLMVSDVDPERAEEKQRALEQIFQSRGFTTIRETINAVDAWLGSLPGQCYANLRQPLIHTLNLAHFCPLSSVWAGPAKNHHLEGPALMQVATDGTTPFRLVTHQGDVGHTMVVGPTGAGKSVLLSILTAQFTRYPQAQVFFFDKGGSARATILGLDGQWSDLGDARTSTFQPLARIDDPAEAAWALDWLLMLISGENLEATPDLKEALWAALQSLADAPIRERTLTGLSLLLQDNTLKQTLQPFTLSGAYGHILDSDTEDLALSSLQGFEMEDIMASEALILPVLTYLFHRLAQHFDGKPTLLVLDEAWVFLDHPIFAARIREWLKTLRKKNVSVVFATQSLVDIEESPIAPALIESCPTRIFLPNGTAREETSRKAYQAFGLNSRQIQLIAEATPKQHYYYQSREGNRLFDLDLGPIALAFCGASSGEDQKAISDLVADHDPGAFGTNWLRHKTLPWAADLISETPQPEIHQEEKHHETSQ